MKNIEINLVTVKDFLAKIGRNLTWLFLVAFLILLVLEALEIKNSVDLALNLNEVLPAKIEKGQRIDFDGYKNAVNRIQSAATFTPSDAVKKDPFSVTVQPQPTP